MEPTKLAEVLKIQDLPRMVSELEAELKKSSAPPALRAPIKHVTAGGKRLRPILVIAAAMAGGGTVTRNVMRSALAVELVHLASLVHDDVIDNATTRRGRTGSLAKEAYSALLAGDWLLAQSQAVAAAVSATAAAAIAHTVSEMAAGQAAQLKLKVPFDLYSKTYLLIIDQKTAALMATAVTLGALSAGLDRPTTKALANYARKFGAAYQIIDDIIDDDIAPAARQMAEQLARHYCSLAAGALQPLPANPVRDGLSRLPGYYLDWALNR